MAGESSLPVNWENKLAKYHVRPYLDVSIDPDTLNIRFSGRHDVKSISEISYGFNPNLANLFEISLKDLTLSFNDSDEFFAPASVRGGFKPFRRITRVLAGGTGASTVDTEPGAFDFVAGDLIIFSDGVNSEYNEVVSFAGNILTFKYTMVNTYVAGDIVTTIPIVGQKVLVNLGLTGLTNKLELFEGIVRQPFTWNGGLANLSLDNKLLRAFNQELKILSTSTNPYTHVNSGGTFSSTIEWTTKTGTGVLSGVTVYGGAKIGSWKITFSSATAFTATGPNTSKVGSTLSDFYDGNDATDSQIKIASTSWSGTPAASDVVEFRISLNFNNLSVPEIIYTILSSHCEIPDSDIDVYNSDPTDSGDTSYSFNKVYLYEPLTISLSFDTPVTAGEAISTVLAHIVGMLTFSSTNKLRLTIMNPFFYMDTVVPEIIGEPVITNTDAFNEITVFYGWDYTQDDDKKWKSYTYPTDNAPALISGTRSSYSIYAPGIYGKSNAEYLAKYIYSIYKFGLFIVTFECTLKNLMADIGDKCTVTIGNPAITLTDCRIFNISRTIGDSNRVTISALYGGFLSNEDSFWSEP